MKDENEHFEKDDEYVELDRSPTNFSSSEEGSNERNNFNMKNLESKINDSLIQMKENRSKHKSSKTNPQSFKLSLLETSNQKNCPSPSNKINGDEEAELI